MGAMAQTCRGLSSKTACGTPLVKKTLTAIFIDVHEFAAQLLLNIPEHQMHGFPAGLLKSVAYACHCLSIVQAFYNVYGLRVYTSCRVGNRQLFVPFSKKVPVNHLAIIVRFLLPCSVCCKVMESIVYESMVFSNSLITKDQFGFLARRSTCTQLLITLNEWTLLTDIRSKIDSVYIDFAKAFDSISLIESCYIS